MSALSPIRRPKDLKKADRSQLLDYYRHCRRMSNEWIRRMVIENNRVDILAVAVMELEVRPFHLNLMRYQFAVPDSLQLCFRGAGKSTVCTVVKGVHYLLKNPNLRILIASKTTTQAESFLKEIKTHFETNDRLAEIFGPYYDPKLVNKWDTREIEVLPRTSRAREGSITCIGFEGMVVGKHYDIIIGDDLVDEDNSRTKAMRDKMRTWYYKSLEPTLEPPSKDVPHRGEFHRLGTRYHFDDLYGHLIANELKERHNIVPALDEHGRSPWPEKYPPEWFEEKRKKSGIIIFNSQYQCHAEETEFLTEKGWRFADDVGSLRLATVDLTTGALEYQNAVGRTRLRFDGELLRIKGKSVDALVTPNHRMLARPSGWIKRESPPQGPWSFVNAEDIAGIAKDRTLLYSGATLKGTRRRTFRVPSGEGGRVDGRGGVRAKHLGFSVPMDVFVRFLGYFASEGSTALKDNGGVRLGQNAGPVLEDMRLCFREMGMEPRESGPLDGCRSLDVRHTGLRNWLRENVKTNSRDARLPRFVFGLAVGQRRALFDALVAGDGHVVKLTKGDESYQYTTTSRALADNVQELALTLGMDATLLDEGGSFGVIARKAIGNGVAPNQINSERYVGDVVCFQVPNGTLITRLNGRALVSGNCDTEAMKGEIFQYDDCQQLDESDWPDTSGLRVFMGVDLAISEKDSGDKFAIVVIGVTADKSAYYVLDFFEGQLRFKAQTAKIVEYAKRWDPVRVGLETVQYQDAQAQAVEEHREEDGSLSEVRLRRINTDKDKEKRAWKLSALFEAKRMFFRKSQQLLIEHLVLFPGHRYKDLFDALDLAVTASKMTKKRRRRDAEPGLI